MLPYKAYMMAAAGSWQPLPQCTHSPVQLKPTGRFGPQEWKDLDLSLLDLTTVVRLRCTRVVLMQTL